MATEAALERTRQAILRAQVYVDRQRDIIAQLEANMADTREAKSFLYTLESSLKLLRDYHRTVSEELFKGSDGQGSARSAQAELSAPGRE